MKKNKQEEVIISSGAAKQKEVPLEEESPNKKNVLSSYITKNEDSATKTNTAV